MILTSQKKIKNKNTSYNNANIPTAPQKKVSNLSTISAINNTKTNSNDISKKIETPIDFIKQKKILIFIHYSILQELKISQNQRQLQWKKYNQKMKY